MCAKKYDNESIRALKGAARVRNRPAVIFGSDAVSYTHLDVYKRQYLGSISSIKSFIILLTQSS